MTEIIPRGVHCAGTNHYVEAVESVIGGTTITTAS